MARRQPDVWLIRHGETEWSRTGRHTGRSDIPLTAEGERQAEELRRRLEGRSFSLVLASPLRRAWDTCRLADRGAEARRRDDLMEWDYGDCDGRTAAEIRAGRPGWRIWDHGVPGGETVEQVGARARRIIDECSRAEGEVAVFAHGHVLRILAVTWLGLPPREAQRFALGTASTGILGEEEGVRLLRAWNLPPGP